MARSQNVSHPQLCLKNLQQASITFWFCMVTAEGSERRCDLEYGVKKNVDFTRRSLVTGNGECVFWVQFKSLGRSTLIIRFWVNTLWLKENLQSSSRNFRKFPLLLVFQSEIFLNVFVFNIFVLILWISIHFVMLGIHSKPSSETSWKTRIYSLTYCLKMFLVSIHPHRILAPYLSAHQ